MPRCSRCGTSEPDEFDTLTAAFCRECWAWITDHGRRFTEWCGATIDRARSATNRSPFR